MHRLNRAELLRKYGMLLILAVIISVISMLSERFFTLSNFLIILRQVSINGIIAAGMTAVILTGGIDLSVGAVLALSGAISASVLAASGSTFAGVTVGLGVGLSIGLVSGSFVALAKLPPFIVTLAVMALSRGLTLVFTQGRPILVDSPGFEFIGGGYLGPVPIPIVLTALVYLILYLILENTKFGRLVYAIGGNEQACRLSGIKIEQIKIAVYGLSGMLSALAAIVLTSRLTSAQPTAGTGYELDAIAAVILGGTSLMGGEGKITGSIVGAIIIGVLANGLNLLNVSPFFQDVAKGLVILVAVLLDKALHVTTQKQEITAS